MTYLRNHCLGRQPMTHEEVNAIYKSGKCPDLCMSHERLRAELTGLEIVAKENEAIVERLREKYQEAKAAYDYRVGINLDGPLVDHLSEELWLLESILNPPKTEQQ